MGVEYKDYYSILGVSKNATEKEIKSTYRKLAREYHPDVNAGSDEKFKDLNETYEALKDPEKRKLYDSLGSNWRQGQNFTPPPGFEGWQNVNMGDMGGMGGFSSFFDAIFGGGMGGGGFAGQGFPGQGFSGGSGAGYEDLFSGARGRGQRAGARGQAQPAEQLNIEEELFLDLEEVAKGVSKEVVTPSRKRLTVNIPKGVKEGAKIRLAGEGHQGHRGRGDLLLVVKYRKHPRFRFEDDSLLYEAMVPTPDLVLGAEIKIPTLSGELSMKIPAGTQPGRLMRLKGQGMPAKDGKAAGDLLVRVQASVPKHPTDRELELYKELQALHAH